MEGLDMPLLGRSVIEDLNLIARLHTTKQSITERYSELFQGLGEMEGEYEIRLKDEVKEELRRMQELGVISPVTEPTDWCAGLVVVPKSDGRVRICVDLTKHNLPNSVGQRCLANWTLIRDIGKLSLLKNTRF